MAKKQDMTPERYGLLGAGALYYLYAQILSSISKSADKITPEKMSKRVSNLMDDPAHDARTLYQEIRRVVGSSSFPKATKKWIIDKSKELSDAVISGSKKEILDVINDIETLEEGVIMREKLFRKELVKKVVPVEESSQIDERILGEIKHILDIYEPYGTNWNDVVVRKRNLMKKIIRSIPDLSPKITQLFNQLSEALSDTLYQEDTLYDFGDTIEDTEVGDEIVGDIRSVLGVSNRETGMYSFVNDKQKDIRKLKSKLLNVASLEGPLNEIQADQVIEMLDQLSSGLEKISDIEDQIEQIVDALYEDDVYTEDVDIKGASEKKDVKWDKTPKVPNISNESKHFDSEFDTLVSESISLFKKKMFGE